MKRKIAYFLILSAIVAATTTSCKKDEKDIESPELTVKGDKDINALNLYQNTLEVSGKVAPDDASGDQITVKITSNADPTGFEASVNVSEGSYTEGKNKYVFKSFNTNFFAANKTDASKKRIKVDANGDVVKVMLGNNIIEKSITINCNEVITMTYWPGSSSATAFLYGYNYNGSENKQLEAWTTRDDQHIPLTVNAFDTAYQANQAFTNYNYDISFIDGWSSYAQGSLGIYPEGDTIFFNYNGTNYYSIYLNNTFAPLVVL